MNSLSLYLWPIAASLAGALWLGALGVHAASRGQMVQVLTGAQASLLGILAGLGLMQELGTGDHAHDWIPLLAGILTCASVLHLLRKAKDPLLVGLFAALIAAGQVLTKMLPGLESHHAHAFLGDLSSMANFDAKVVLVVSTLGSLALIGLRRAIVRETFEIATFGRALGRAGVYEVSVLVGLAVGVQFLGFLFTTAALALPTALWRGLAPRSSLRLTCGGFESACSWGPLSATGVVVEAGTADRTLRGPGDCPDRPWWVGPRAPLSDRENDLQTHVETGISGRAGEPCVPEVQDPFDLLSELKVNPTVGSTRNPPPFVAEKPPPAPRRTVKVIPTGLNLKISVPARIPPKETAPVAPAESCPV